MSLDNVIAIAAAAKRQLWRSCWSLGLAISVPLIVAGSALIMALLERSRSWSGPAPRCSAGSPARLIATDPVAVGAICRRRLRRGCRAQGRIRRRRPPGAMLVVVLIGGLWRRSRHRRSAERGLTCAAASTSRQSRVTTSYELPPMNQAVRAAGCQADRLLRLSARLPLDLRARGRGARRAHHRPRARRARTTTTRRA